MSSKIQSAITQITLNEATFHNQNFTPTYINFIFGNNGSGKSTIAKVINKQQSLTWETGRSSNDYLIQVYNEEFIKKNVESYDEMPGVFTISEQNISIQNQIKEATIKLEEAQTMLSETTTKLRENEELRNNQDETFQNICWNKTKDIRKLLSAALEGKKTKDGFSKAILAETSPIDFDQDALIAMCDAAFSSDATAYPEMQTGDSSTLEESELLKKIIISHSDSPFATFMEAINATNWVRQGHENFHEIADGKCPYCQEALNDDFEEILAECFDEQYEIDLSNLRAFKTTYGNNANEMWTIFANNLKNSYPKISSELKDFSDLFEIFKAKMQINAQRLEEKLKEPNKVVTLEDLSETVTELNTMIDNMNKKIRENNNIFNDRTKKRPVCKKNAVKYLTFLLKSEIENFNKSRSDLKKEIDKLTTSKTDAEQAIQLLRGNISKLSKQVVNTTAAVEGINTLLRDTGFQGFYLREKADTPNVYEVVRSSTGLVAENLSEGERNFIAFLYFHQLILGSEDAEAVVKDRIVVIDDPVSSMDSSALFVVGALVREMIAICNPDYTTKENPNESIKQLFILTHNAFFHQEVTYNQVQHFQYVSFFEINKLENQSSVNLCTQRRTDTPSIIENRNPVQNSYATLWDTYKEVSSPSTLVNVIRQILDYYFLQLCGYDGVKIKDEILKTHREDFVTKLPDGTEDCSELHMAAALLQYMSASNDRISDGLNFIHTSMDVDTCRRIFKKIFRNIGQGQHYDMMMKRSK